MLKDRTTNEYDKKLRTVQISLRMTPKEAKELTEYAEKKNIPKTVMSRKIIISHVRKDTEKKSDEEEDPEWICDQCDKKIKSNETYYIEQANFEKYTKESEEYVVDVLDSVYLKMLCFTCAEKKGKLKNFAGERTGGDMQVKESFR